MTAEIIYRGRHCPSEQCCLAGLYRYEPAPLFACSDHHFDFATSPQLLSVYLYVCLRVLCVSAGIFLSSI
jgi:hypothetical protein